jgi:hypothetical protein
MPRSPAEELRIETRRLKVAELYLHGTRCLTHIAHELKVDKATISRDLKHIRKLWRETYVDELDVAIRDELAGIAEILSKAWLGWERSCKDVETMEVIGTSQGGKSKPDKVKKITKRQAGDSRFLAIALGCVKLRCELLGLDMPKQLNHSGQVSINWDELCTRGPVRDVVEERIVAPFTNNGQENGQPS